MSTVTAAKEAAQATVSTEKAPSSAASVLNYTALSSFSWDQDNDKIRVFFLFLFILKFDFFRKHYLNSFWTNLILFCCRFLQIYIFLEGVEQEKVEASFNPTSIDIKFHDVKGKNYRCAIPKLHKEIDPEKCKVVVKPTKVLITLFKASKGTWLDLHFKDDKVLSMFSTPYDLSR